MVYKSILAVGTILLAACGSNSDGGRPMEAGNLMPLVDVGDPIQLDARSVGVEQRLDFRLTDNAGGSNSDSVEVVVAPAGDTAPVVEAGEPIVAEPNQWVTITAIASGAAAELGSILWAQTGGDRLELIGTSTLTLAFTVPDVVKNGRLVFSVTLTDASGAKATDTVTVSVTEPGNSRPLANAHPDPVAQERVVDNAGLNNADAATIGAGDTGDEWPLKDGSVSLSTLDYSPLVGDRLCEALLFKKAKLQSAQAHTAKYTVLIDSKNQALSALKNALIELDNSLNGMVADKSAADELLPGMETSLTALEREQDTLSKNYRNCQQVQGDESAKCNLISDNYIEKRDEYRAYRDDVVRVQQQKIETLESQIAQFVHEKERLEGEVAQLQGFVDGAAKANRQFDLASTDYINSLGLPGQRLFVTLRAPSALSANSDLVDTKMLFVADDTPVAAVATPPGLLGVESAFVIPSLSLSPKTWATLWPVLDAQASVGKMFDRLAHEGLEIELATDGQLGCKLRSNKEASLKPTSDRDLFSGTYPSVLLTTSQVTAIKNTYSVTINPELVFNQLRSLSSKQGYISSESVLKAVANKSAGFEIALLEERDANETAAIKERLKDDFLSRLMLSIAVPAPLKPSATCDIGSLWCYVQGWWLDSVASPVVNQGVIESLLAESPEPFTMQVQDRVFLHSYNSVLLSF